MIFTENDTEMLMLLVLNNLIRRDDHGRIINEIAPLTSFQAFYEYLTPLIDYKENAKDIINALLKQMHIKSYIEIETDCVRMRQEGIDLYRKICYVI